MNRTGVESRQGRIQVSGPLCFDTVPDLWETGVRLIRDGAREVDFGGVGEVDSSALALLMEWRRAAARQGSELRFHAVPAPIREIAALSEVDQVLGLES